MNYTPATSAMANFVRQFPLPCADDLRRIGGKAGHAELQIGTLVRLHSRAAAKLVFTPDMKKQFAQLAYTGPLSHESVYREVTTIGVNYYQFNKGMKERKVFLHGNLIRLPLHMGVVKLGTRPLRFDEVGSRFVMYRSQTMLIYSGDLVLEGNCVGSYVSPLPLSVSTLFFICFLFGVFANLLFV